MELKEIAIGKIVRFHGIRLQVVKAVQGCRGCIFKHDNSCHPEIVGVCAPPWRRIAVIFRKYDESKKENLHTKHPKAYKAAMRILGRAKNG